jgi:hypothetical protein
VVVPDVLADHRPDAILHGERVSEDRQDQPAGEWANLAFSADPGAQAAYLTST